MMIGVPNAIEKTIPLARNDRRISKGLTGLTIACVESAILCPAERLKVYLMTNNLLKSDLSLYSRFKADSQAGIVRELYRGYLPLFTRQAVAWITFLVADA